MDNFEEFKEKIHPYYGKANYTDNMQLLRYILEKEEEKEEN